MSEHSLLPAEPAVSTPAADRTPRVSADWRQGLPTLRGSGLSVRALRVSDAPSVFAMIATDDVTRFISPPPVSVQGFERFIGCANDDRGVGNGFCFAVVPEDVDVPVGIFQVRRLEPSFETAEWGFALSDKFWGTGLFVASARLALQFLFEQGGIHRLEARTLLSNERGNGVLKKLGATREAVLRRGFHKGEHFYDQVLWAILADEWLAAHGRGVSS